MKFSLGGLLKKGAKLVGGLFGKHKKGGKKEKKKKAVKKVKKTVKAVKKKGKIVKKKI
jgi:hypothetical protein